MSANNTIYVTGGAQGIGLGIAEMLLHDGYCVAITDRDEEALTAAAERLPHRDKLLVLTADASDEAQVAASIEKTVKHFGQQLSLDKWQAYLGTNLTGAFLCAKHGAKHLRQQRGSMVLMASSRALQSEPDTEAYAASKGGIVALTHALAISLGPDIRVNAISPGWIEVGD